MNNLNKKIGIDFNVSVCICTRNRPQELSKALHSVERSTYPAFEVIVSDDSTNDDTKKLMISHFPTVKYLEGPRKGLGANRNNVLKSVTGSHVLFIDDDVVLHENFLEMVCNKLAKIAEKEIYLMKSEIANTKDAIIILEHQLLTMQDIMNLVLQFGKGDYKFFSLDCALNIELTYNLLQHFKQEKVLVF